MKDSYWKAFKDYHGNDVYGRFLKWLEKINRRHKRFMKKVEGGD